MAYNVLDPFEPISTPYRARRALEGAHAAAWLLMAMNLFIAGLTTLRPRRTPTLIGDDPQTFIVAQLAAAAFAAILAVILMRRHLPWACWTVAAWSVLEAMPWVTGKIYAHAAFLQLSLLGLLFAVQGVRGSVATRRFANGAPSAENVGQDA